MGIRLNLGCGERTETGYLGLDILLTSATDIICDLNKPLPFASGTVEMVYAKSVLEHLDNLEGLLREIHRVLQPDGKVYVYVPHWTNPFFYSDYTHRRFFGLATFDYFAVKGDHVYRQVPTYTNFFFHTCQVRLLFFSPFSIIHMWMKLWQKVMNRYPRWQLFYEYHLSTFWPCYAIEYILTKMEPSS